MPEQFVSESIEIDASAADVFAIYADVDAWPQWDPDVQEAGINGPFAVGQSGWIKPHRAPRMTTLITALSPNRSFSAQTRLPLCRLTFSHHIGLSGSSKGQPVLVTHGAEFSGPLASVFGWIIGRQIRRGLPASLAGLKRYAQARVSGREPS